MHPGYNFVLQSLHYRKNEKTYNSASADVTKIYKVHTYIYAYIYIIVNIVSFWLIFSLDNN